jgi:hypothetical protein
MVHDRIFNILHRFVVQKRKPDVMIGGFDDPYLARWWVIPRNRFFNIYLHLFYRSDDDRALHDHPWVNASYLLSGSYIEHTIQAGGVNVRTLRNAGDLAMRRSVSAHRVELIDGRSCWSLFITGPIIRSWGFHCEKGWKHWKDFTAFRSSGNSNMIGPGCGEDDGARQ